MRAAALLLPALLACSGTNNNQRPKLLDGGAAWDGWGSDAGWAPSERLGLPDASTPAYEGPLPDYPACQPGVTCPGPLPCPTCPT